MKCKYCSAACKKKGFYQAVQKFYCGTCGKYQREKYKYKLTAPDADDNIALLTKESMSISSIARYLQIPKTTVQRRILIIASSIAEPAYTEVNQVYEVDEMQTFVVNKAGKQQLFITYAINRLSKSVVGFIAGSRTKITINKVINKVLSLNPKKIYTDGLNIYPSLIPKQVHRCFRYRTNIIERKNLNLRTHIKRLSRKKICFSKSILMLEACLKIYFWG